MRTSVVLLRTVINFHQFNKFQSSLASKGLRESLKESLPKSESPQNLKTNGTESISLVSVDKIKRVLEEKPSSSQSEKENSAKATEDESRYKSEKNSTMLSNPIESHYSREQDLRYTSLSDVSRSISSYAIDTVASNRLAMPDYDVQTVHSTNHRPYDPGSLVNTQTAFERYDPNYPLQRTSMYSSYGQPSLEELASQQKYLLEHSQQQQTTIMKTEPDETNSGPIYPRPIYQSYDPTGKFREILLGNCEKIAEKIRKLLGENDFTDGKFCFSVRGKQ
jgi:hypothetical protein